MRVTLRDLYGSALVIKHKSEIVDHIIKHPCMGGVVPLGDWRLVLSRRSDWNALMNLKSVGYEIELTDEDFENGEQPQRRQYNEDTADGV